MWSAMRGTGNLASPLYFIVIQAIGNFIVLNGLVALLINSMFTDETRQKMQRELMALKKRQSRLERAASRVVIRSFKAARKLARTESFEEFERRRRRMARRLSASAMDELMAAATGEGEEAEEEAPKKPVHRGSVFAHPLGVFGEPLLDSDEEEEREEERRRARRAEAQGRLPAPASGTDLAGIELRLLPPAASVTSVQLSGEPPQGSAAGAGAGAGAGTPPEGGYRRFRPGSISISGSGAGAGSDARLADRSGPPAPPTPPSGRLPQSSSLQVPAAARPPRGVIPLSSSTNGSRLASSAGADGGVSVSVIHWSNSSENNDSGSSNAASDAPLKPHRAGPPPPAPAVLFQPADPDAPPKRVLPAPPPLELPSPPSFSGGAAGAAGVAGAGMVSPDDKLSEEEKRKRKKMIGNAVRDAFGGVRVTAGYHKPLQAPAYTPLVRKKSFDDADWDYRNFEKSSLVSWRAGWSLFLWSPTNRARMGLHALVKHRYFERLIILIIIGSCILLLLDYPNCPFADNVRYADAAFTCLFCMEAIMKILAMGFVLDRGSYMRDPWNWLDLAIAVVSASSLPEVAEGGSSGGQRATRVLRVFRAMRPIRLVQRFRGVRVVITSIVKALPYIGRVSLLVFIMWGFFAVMGMQLFMGRLSYCSEVTLDQADCVGQATVQGGAPIEREWRSNWENFDHIGNAMMTLFEMATLENWVFVMYSAMDSTGVTTAPQIESNVAASVFFLLFIICGVYAVMNWYISVVVMAFTQAQEELRVERDANESPDALHIDTDDLSNDQKQWAEMLQLAMDRPLRPRIRKPQAAWRKAADAVVRHKWSARLLNTNLI
eukprot:tig00000254_g22450.t1